MSFLDSIEVPPRRTDRKTCQHCEASASGCRSNAWLRGRNCCERCPGDHDTPDHDRSDAATHGVGSSPETADLIAAPVVHHSEED